MFYDNLRSACEAQGMRVSPLLAELEISTGNIGRWRKGADVSSSTLEKLVRRLGVSADFLLFGESMSKETSRPFLSAEEQELLNKFRDFTDYQKAQCIAYVRGMHDSEPREKTLPKAEGKSAV